MKRLTLKNMEKATALVMELGKAKTKEEAENIAINAFAMYQNFNKQYKDVEHVIYTM